MTQEEKTGTQSAMAALSNAVNQAAEQKAEADETPGTKPVVLSAPKLGDAVLTEGPATGYGEKIAELKEYVADFNARTGSGAVGKVGVVNAFRLGLGLEQKEKAIKAPKQKTYSKGTEELKGVGCFTVGGFVVGFLGGLIFNGGDLGMGVGTGVFFAIITAAASLWESFKKK